MIKQGDVVKVLWLDSFSYGGGGWEDSDGFRTWAEEPLQEIVSVGKVAFITKDAITLVLSENPHQVQGNIKIPHFAIKEITVYKEDEVLNSIEARKEDEEQG